MTAPVCCVDAAIALSVYPLAGYSSLPAPKPFFGIPLSTNTPSIKKVLTMSLLSFCFLMEDIRQITDFSWNKNEP